MSQEEKAARVARRWLRQQLGTAPLSLGACCSRPGA